MNAIEYLRDTQKVMPIILAHSPEQGVNIAKAMQNGGAKVVEVVLRTEASLAIVKAIKEALPQLIVGAGTILSPEDADNAIEAGADFLVTPTISEALLAHLRDCKVPTIPGVSNNADILLAREYGFKTQKLFPATLCGGTKFLSAISTVFQDIIFCPTGGVNIDNKDEFLALNNVFAVGGTWMVSKDAVANEDWQAIEEASRKAFG